jgi:hypothetical protein
VWDVGRLSRFEWLWYDVTSFEHYSSEAIYKKFTVNLLLAFLLLLLLFPLVFSSSASVL